MSAADLISPFARGPHLLGFPTPDRRLRIGIVGGGRISKVQTLAMRLSDRWDVIAGAFSSDLETSRKAGKTWHISPDRTYATYREMAEKEAKRSDGIEAVAIATPNHTHYDVARVFIDAGIDVFCEKPLTTTLEDALLLRKCVHQSGLVFMVAHAYSGHAMVRQAKAMIAAGEIGRIRQIHVEYVQEWMMHDAITNFKHVQWRQNPEQAGQTACTADIGTHAHHLACFVTGLEMTSLRAELLVCGPPKELDDTVYVSARYEGDVPGLLWASQVAIGDFVGLRMRIYGEKGSLKWDQENPEQILFSRMGRHAEVVRRGFGAGNNPNAERLTRAPSGNVEGWLEAWANLFTEFEIAVAARRAGQTLPVGLLQYPTIDDGVRGMKFIDAVVQSHTAGGIWVNCGPEDGQ